MKMNLSWKDFVPSLIYLVVFVVCVLVFGICVPENGLLANDNSSAAFISGAAFVFLGFFIGEVLGTILNFFRRRQKKVNVKRCPMLECSDRGCVYYDQHCLICKFADRPELLQEDPSDD